YEIGQCLEFRRVLFRSPSTCLLGACMQIDLANRAAIVTGGSKGLGFAIANRFAASGADVLIAARGREPLDAAVKSISAGAKGRRSEERRVGKEGRAWGG